MPSSSGSSSLWLTDWLCQKLSTSQQSIELHKTSTSNLQNPINGFHNWMRRSGERCILEFTRICISLASTLIYCRNKSTVVKVWFNFSGIKVSSEACRYTNQQRERHGTFVQRMCKDIPHKCFLTWFLKYRQVSFTQHYSPILAILQRNTIISFNKNVYKHLYWTFNNHHQPHSHKDHFLVV
jgi:hypothetical protein